MGLLDDLKREQQARDGVRCRTCQFLLKLSPKERAEVEEALDNEQNYGTVIADVINEKFAVKTGLVVGHRSLQRHRAGRHMPT